MKLACQLGGHILWRQWPEASQPVLPDCSTSRQETHDFWCSREPSCSQCCFHLPPPPVCIPPEWGVVKLVIWYSKRISKMVRGGCAKSTFLTFPVTITLSKEGFGTVRFAVQSLPHLYLLASYTHTSTMHLSSHGRQLVIGNMPVLLSGSRWKEAPASSSTITLQLCSVFLPPLLSSLAPLLYSLLLFQDCYINDSLHTIRAVHGGHLGSHNLHMTHGYQSSGNEGSSLASVCIAS